MVAGATVTGGRERASAAARTAATKGGRVGRIRGTRAVVRTAGIDYRRGDCSGGVLVLTAAVVLSAAYRLHHPGNAAVWSSRRWFRRTRLLTRTNRLAATRC